MTPIHLYAAPGEYLVTLTVINACGSVATREQSVTISSNASVPAFLKDFGLFPNPVAYDYFTIHLSGLPREMIQIAVFNNTGQAILREAWTFQSGAAFKRVSSRDWPAGVYWVWVSDGHESGFRKIVVK